MWSGLFCGICNNRVPCCHVAPCELYADSPMLKNSRCSPLKNNTKTVFCYCCVFFNTVCYSSYSTRAPGCLYTRKIKHLISHIFMPRCFVINSRLKYSESASANILYSSSGIHIQRHTAAYKY